MDRGGVLSALACVFGLGLFCLVPLCATGLFLLYRHITHVGSSPATGGRRSPLDRVLLPDPARARELYDRLSATSPHLDRDAIIAQIVQRTAFECGFIGFVTGFPGLPLLPLTVPADFIVAGRLQAAMVQAITHAYGRPLGGGAPDLAAKQTYLLMYGGTEAMRGVGQFAIRVVLKPLCEAIPILGGVVGFAVNYSFTKATAAVAIRHGIGTLTTRGITDEVFTRAEQLRGEAGRLREEARARAAIPPPLTPPDVPDIAPPLASEVPLSALRNGEQAKHPLATMLGPAGEVAQ